MKMSPCGRGCGSNPGQHGHIDHEPERTGLDDDHDRDQTPGTNAGAVSFGPVHFVPARLRRSQRRGRKSRKNRAELRFSPVSF